MEDIIIRESYYVGSTDSYKKYCRNVKYYDVNSLSPKAMLNDKPGKFIGELNPYTTNIEDVFGFVEVIITCPKDIGNPILIHHSNGKNIPQLLEKLLILAKN